jgi:hypothetical protein
MVLIVGKLNHAKTPSICGNGSRSSTLKHAVLGAIVGKIWAPLSAALGNVRPT